MKERAKRQMAATIAGLLLVSVFVMAAYTVGFKYGRGHVEQCSEYGTPNRFGNLPYTQGSLDAEGRMQREAVSRGFAAHVDRWFIWNNDSQRFPWVDPEHNYRDEDKP